MCADVKCLPISARSRLAWRFKMPAAQLRRGPRRTGGRKPSVLVGPDEDAAALHTGRW